MTVKAVWVSMWILIWGIHLCFHSYLNVTFKCFIFFKVLRKQSYCNGNTSYLNYYQNLDWYIIFHHSYSSLLLKVWINQSGCVYWTNFSKKSLYFVYMYIHRNESVIYQQETQNNPCAFGAGKASWDCWYVLGITFQDQKSINLWKSRGSRKRWAKV